MINVKKSQKNKTLYLKNLKTLNPSHKAKSLQSPPPHTRLCANTKLLQHQKCKKANHNKSLNHTQR